ncbi:TRAP transporter small permease [Phaeobacter sp. CAU 1743]|uniref:TRAP transporter small permease n=1 Tax=Phaeobacter sp. CAU 1743 TaxID=3140367 RepID=UPI00325B84BF
MQDSATNQFNHLFHRSRRISELAVMLGGILMALMVLHVVADVTLRYVVGVPLSGTTEIVSRYYMVALIFLPLAFVQATDQHISASLLSDLLSARVGILLDFLTAILMGIYGALLAWRTGVEALRATEIHEQIQTSSFFLPTWPARWIPVLAMGLVVLVSGLALITHFTRFLHYGRNIEAARKKETQRGVNS